MPDNVLTIYCDGLCEPRNPDGWACWAWVAFSPKGARLREAYGCLGHGLGMTNNRAEYAAFLNALRYTLGRAAMLAERDIGVLVRGDSMLVINQINGSWACRSPHLQPMLRGAARLVNELNEAGVAISFEWVPREQNEEADALSRKAYAEARQARRTEEALL